MDITKKVDRTALKGYFVKNAVPTAANFADLIDGVINQREDGIAKLAGEPLSLEADGDNTSQKKVINFFRSFLDPKPAWTLSLNPRTDPNNPATARAGFGIGDADGNSKLFIDQTTGHVGIGLASPTQRLHVGGGNAIINNVFLGDVGHGAGWAGFSHTAVPAPATSSYGFMQNNTGQFTVINKKSGAGYIGLRIDNVDKFVLADNGNVGIGNTGPAVALEVNGAVAVNNGAAYAPRNGRMAPGSLTIGSITATYGGGSGWTASTAGLLLETLTNTEIAVHDSGQRLTSLLYFEGDSSNRITLGRDMGWGTVGQVVMYGAVGIGTASPSHRFHVVAPDAVGLFESSGGQAYLRLSTNEGINNRVEITNRPGGRLSLWTAGAGDVFNILRDGRVGIGTTDPAAKLHVVGAIYAGNSDMYFTNTEHNHSGVGNAAGWAAIENSKDYDALMILGRAGTANGRKIRVWDYFQVHGTFVNNSDAREKRDVADLPYGLKEVMQLRPVSFNWKEIANPHKSMGLLAQEVRPIVNEAVYVDGHGTEDHLSIAYTSLIPVLINAIKELAGQVEHLSSMVPARGER